jgi:hypothetical protein
LDDQVIDDVLISAGSAGRKFEVIGSIFAFGTAVAGADPGEAFEKVKQDLAAKCRSLNGNAVLNCLFEYRAPDSPVCFGVVDIIAYGTAVRII